MTIRIRFLLREKKKLIRTNHVIIQLKILSNRPKRLTSNTEEAWKIHEGFERDRKLSQAQVSRADGLIIGGRLAPAWNGTEATSTVTISGDRRDDIVK